MVPPVLVKPEAVVGTGSLGQATKDVYHLSTSGLYLVGTSKVALAVSHSDEILDADFLPRRYATFSPCFHREADSYGKDTRDVFHVYWFDKVEMFICCLPEDAEDQHQRLLGFEKELLRALETPLQILDVASRDLGLSAARKYDCYAWLPTQQCYREATSTSDCTQFRTRRLEVRYRIERGTGCVATLNGTLCAMTRIIIMLFESHQQTDGSVRVPEALRPHLGSLEVFTAD